MAVAIPGVVYCKIKGCPNVGFHEIEIDTGPNLDEHTRIAEPARRQKVRVCGRHLAQLRTL